MVIGTVRGEESTGCSGEACSTDPSVDILGDSNATLISNLNISQLNEQYSSDIEEEIKQELEKERMEIGRAADELGLFKESGLNGNLKFNYVCYKDTIKSCFVCF